MSHINADMYTQVDILNSVIHGAYFAGLACEIAGLGFGLFGRSVKAGRLGLILSLCVLCLMVIFTLVNHYENGNGQWIWSATVGDDGQSPELIPANYSCPNCPA